MNKDFYPTPLSLIYKMISGIDFEMVKSVLEPSAGKGDIIDRLKDKKVSIDAIEIDDDLRATLRGKGYNVVFDDFLEYSTAKKYDLIIANFPFSDGDSHLLKAIQLQEMYGGGIICLVNAETIKNPFTNQRKLLAEKLKQYNAQIEYLEHEFTDAERKTDVEVALVKLFIDQNNDSFLILDSLRKSEDIKSEEDFNQVIEKDFVKALISRFNFESKVGIKLILEYRSLQPYIVNSLKKESYNKPIIELTIDREKYGDNQINDYLKALRYKYWSVLLSDNKFRGKFTTNIQKELSSKLELLREFDFSLYNIRELEKELSKNIVSGIESAILKMFDEFSHQYTYNPEFSKNIHYYNGWKSNKAHYINKKIILPINGFSSYSWDKNKLDTYYISEKINDIVKVFNYLSGNTENPANLIHHQLEESNKLTNFRDLYFLYFTATFYKKGTCHITFTDDELLKKFNIFGSQRKGWLPPCYGKKSYSEMTPEEREVINDFEGKDSYNDVYLNQDKYLVDNNQFLLELPN